MLFRLFLSVFIYLSLAIFSSTAFSETKRIEARVSSGNDDAEERIRDGDMYRNSTDLEFGYDSHVGGLQIVGMRFRNIDIPQGAIIISAYVEFTVDEADSGATNFVIFGQDHDDPNQFANNDGNISLRTKTSASVSWSPSEWDEDDEEQTPDLSSIIQEIVNRAGWKANNNVVLIVEPTSGCIGSNCQRTAESFDGDDDDAPLLVVNYTMTSGILSPSDGILGGELNNGNFVIGSVGSGDNQWPNDEGPEHLIDDVGQKYLNFGKQNTGAIITPGIGCSVVDSIKFWTANDNESRDPASYKLYGTNNSISNVTNPLSDFTLLSEGNLSLPASRNADGNSPLEGSNSQTISFVNSASYTSYLVLFPTVKNSINANSMQLGEVQLFGSANNCSPMEVIAGRVTLKNTKLEPEFTSVCFDTAFTEVPRVFSMPTTAADSDRLALRIRNVTKTGFEIAQVESAVIGSTPSGNLTQTVDFLAIPEGDYSLDGGAKMRVSALSTKKFQGKRVSGNSWGTVNTTDVGFSQSPAIIASIQTMNNETDPFPISEPFLATAIKNIDSTAFQMALERGETSTGSLDSNETIAYIAITPDKNGQLTDDISYESFRTSDNVTGINSCSRINLNGNYSSGNPLVIASQNTRDGADGGWVKRCAISAFSVGFSVVEDMANDRDQNHTNERVGGIALGGAFTNQTCDVPPDNVHHYEIIHDGQGLTCEDETIIVKACADSTCSSLISDADDLNVFVNGSSIGTATFTSDGRASVSFSHTTDETVTLSVDSSIPLECNANNVNACNITFENAGFRYLSGSGNSSTIPNQIAGSEFSEALKIQAVKDINGVCTGFFNANDGDHAVKLSQINVAPTTLGLSFNVDGQDIAVDPSVTLNFDTNSTAIIPKPIYNDAGEIRLQADFDDGTVQLSGSSNTFWVRPAKLVVSAKSAGSDLNGDTAMTAKIHAAGDDFEFTVSAYNAANPPVVTPNYSPGQIQLNLTRTVPALSDSVDGLFTYATSKTVARSTGFQDVTLSTFSSGISSYTEAKYSEVGLFNLDIQDREYGNAAQTIPADAINVGRFTPKYFEQTIAEHGNLSATCGGGTRFVYSGQTEESDASIGAISYLMNPVLAITAYNSQGDVTENYLGDFMKLTASGVSITSPTQDEATTGVNNNRLPLTANMQDEGTLSSNDLTALPTVVTLPKGVLHYEFSDDDNFIYSRSDNALVAPFTADIDFAIASISDTDSVNLRASMTVDASPAGVEVRFGRLVLQNSFGPEGTDLVQSLQVEHFDGRIFSVSTDNNCLSYDDTDLSSNPDIDTRGGTGLFVNGETRDILLDARDADSSGNINVSYDTYDWLEFDWDNIPGYEDPSAIATFGLFRGNDRVIYRRVVN